MNETCKHASAVDIGSLKISDLSEVWDLVSSCENELAHGPRVELVVEELEHLWAVPVLESLPGLGFGATDSSTNTAIAPPVIVRVILGDGDSDLSSHGTNDVLTVSTSVEFGVGVGVGAIVVVVLGIRVGHGAGVGLSVVVVGAGISVGITLGVRLSVPSLGEGAGGGDGVGSLNNVVGERAGDGSGSGSGNSVVLGVGAH